MISLPPRRQWTQNNRSDVLGSLWSSFNLNLTEQLGKTQVSSRMYITTNAITNLGTGVSFREFVGNLYGLAPTSTSSQHGIYVSTGGQLRNIFAADGTAGSGGVNFSSDYSDMEIFNGALLASSSDTSIIYTLDGLGWTSTGGHGGVISAGMLSNANHKMIGFLKTNRLYYTATLLQIFSIDTLFSPNTTPASTNTFAIKNADLFLVTLLQTPDLMWILTVNNNNNNGYIYTWDGVTADTPNSIIPLDSRGALAGIIKDGTPYIINTDARLQYFNGSTFVDAPMGQLPVKSVKYLTNSISQKNNRWIHPNGITIVNGRINILVNNQYNDSTGSIEQNLASGIWEYDKAIGWYHKGALTQYDLNGAATITDYGQNRISRVGALVNLKPSDIGSPVGTIMAGADYFNDATTVKSAIYTNDSLDLVQKYGYLVSTKIFAKDIQDTWAQIYIRLKPLLAASDKIWLKFRYSDATSTEATITWIDSRTFTTTTDVSSYVQGNEAEIISGQGSGWCGNITSVTNNSGTYTVVLEDMLPFVPTGTAKARFQTWQKGGSFNTQKIGLASFSTLTNASASYIQIKICCLFTGNDEVLDIILQNTPLQ